MKRVLNVVLSHLPAVVGQPWLDWRAAVCPGEECLLVYTGSEADFAALHHEPRLHLACRRLKTRQHQRERQAYTEVWSAVAGWLRERDHSHVRFMEYDHLPLVPDLSARWLAYLEERDADIAGYAVTRVDGTNNPHALYHDVDRALGRYLETISVRADRHIVLSMLGTGSLWTRDSFLAVAEMREPFPVYLELWLPTVAHHLGYRVVDMPAEQKPWVRSRGEFSDRIDAARQAGAWSIHPIKRPPRCPPAAASMSR
ncbi:MAG TPA: hypothetical protein PKE12_09050 [Kiritimatiellia bacterium]|nr:hypothetical protein [Kiritimatiellia bacterium]